MNIATLPPGRYVIGDLCYRNVNDWDQMIESYEPGKAKTLDDGRHYVILKTAYGDGTYLDQDGKQYWVDSGTIGICQYDGTLDSEMGRTFDFSSDFNVFNDKGVLHFGAVYIDTDPSYDDVVDFEETDNALEEE
jgi:hypothetical protein